MDLSLPYYLVFSLTNFFFLACFLFFCWLEFSCLPFPPDSFRSYTTCDCIGISKVFLDMCSLAEENTSEIVSTEIYHRHMSLALSPLKWQQFWKEIAFSSAWMDAENNGRIHIPTPGNETMKVIFGNNESNIWWLFIPYFEKRINRLVEKTFSLMTFLGFMSLSFIVI